MVVIGFLPSPIDFGSVDGNPVSTLFLLLAPTVKVHLALLSRLAFCLQDDAFVQMLHSDPDDDTVWRELERIGTDLAEPERP
jgi:PTS system nitrogen regulatory IIA component